MSDFIFFLGRFHVLVLHLPIGIVLLTVVMDIVSRRSPHAYLRQALPLCWAATALTASLAAVLGLMHFSEGGFDGSAAYAHRNYGISLAATSLVVWLLVAQFPSLYSRARVFSNVLLLFLVTMTGHYGGNLTHGATYLVEYAPAPLRNLAGLEQRRPAPVAVAAADPWHDVVRPLLQERCADCHNPDKRRGQLDLSSLDALLAGGEGGVVVRPGDAAGSDLFRRITLPQDHEDVMPAEGKAALTETQVRILGWWIDAGMPVDKTLGEVPVEGSIVDLVATELGLATAQPFSAASYPEVSQETLAQLRSQGWLVRLQSQDSNGLLLSRASPGRAVSAPMLEALAAAGPSIIDLNLAGARLDDALLTLLGNMTVVETLNLGDNSLTDAGLTAVAGFQSLRVLNLHGNRGISDAGLDSLTGLSKLKRLYLWETGVSPAGVAALAAALPGLAVETGAGMAAQ